MFWSTCKWIIEPKQNDMEKFQLYKFLLRNIQEKACSIPKRFGGVTKITGFIHKNVDNLHLKDKKVLKVQLIVSDKEC